MSGNQKSKQKWVGLVKVFDQKMSGEWHSGSSTTYNAKAGMDSKEEAEEYIASVTERYDGEKGYNRHREKYDKYELTPCILSYDESQSENVEKFFKYMS